jgi:hypothetical protein
MTAPTDSVVWNITMSADGYVAVLARPKSRAASSVAHLMYRVRC